MAKAQQLKALLQSHMEGDEARFYAIAMQIAAHEAKVGHGALATELRALIDEAKRREKRTPAKGPVPIVQPRGELSSLLSASFPKVRLADMVLPQSVEDRLSRILKEQRQLAKLRTHALHPRRKLLLLGPPGTGKTMCASALAGELDLPLFVIRLDGIITKYLGETAAKLRLVFDAIAQTRGVYLFDEFDSIGTQRAFPNEVGEIRRVLNSFLQFIDQDDSDSLILAATNHPEILDYALYRRFDDVISFALPDHERIVDTLRAKLAAFRKEGIDWASLAREAEGLSYAEVTRACEGAVKDMIIHDLPALEQPLLSRAIQERKSIPSSTCTSA
ncbi:MAG: ATP-binding protein [Deferrisomatales bacterium]|nr:ATP-binding protein [Deferrisomatales bacterium]